MRGAGRTGAGMILKDASSTAAPDDAVSAKLATLAAGRSICAQLGPLPANVAQASCADLQADTYTERYATSM